MLLQPVGLPVYCAGFDSVPPGVLGQGNQPAIFPTPPPAFSPQSFGNVDEHEEEMDQDGEAPILRGKIGNKLTKAGNVPMREQRKEQRPERCPFPKCQYSTKGFAYSSEAGRHIRAKHKSEIKNLTTTDKAHFKLIENPPKQHFCTEEGCLKGYGRGDHLRRHLRGKHGRPTKKRGRHARK